MARDRRDEEIEQLAAEVDSLAPYLELAREIRREAERVASDDDAALESFATALDALPDRERAAVARSVFDRLPPAEQWSVLERLFGDDELRRHLDSERTGRLHALRRQAEVGAVLDDAVSDGRLDTRRLPEGTALTLGLFRAEDVRAGLERGPDSDVCARQLVLRASEVPGELRVIDDVFNPRGGLFVTAAYDRAVWRAEQLAGHRTVRVGSLAGGPGGDGGAVLEPVLYRGARVDVESDGVPREGSLHLGYAQVGEVDAFATRS